MIFNKTELLNKAINIATEAHKNQTDRYGAPYLGHVFRVMNYGKTMDEKILGVLHDVVEDCSEWSFEKLSGEGFGNYIEALDCLTKRDGEKYSAFVARTEKNSLAIAVKLNDLRDNMDIRRINRMLSSDDTKRLNKYLKAYRYLTEKY